jgi:predicted permease
MALMTSLIVGLVPAFRMMRQYRRLELHDGGRSATVSLDKQRIRRIFVIGEIALAYLLLVGTGLFLVNLGKLQQGNTGFNSRGLLAGKVQYAGEEFKKNQQAQAAFVRGTVDRLALQPGVRAAAAVEPLPFDPEPGGSNTFDIEGNPKNADNPEPHSHLTYATPDYLTVMQIPLLAGRWFTDDDRKTAPRVVVIDQRLAHKYWPNQNPIGQHLDSDSANGWATVVGIVGNIRSDSLETDTTDGMRYYPFAQVDDLMANFLVRTDGAPGRLAPAIKHAVNSVDPSQAVSTITSVETLVSDSLAGRRLIAWMLTAFASLALLLAVIGIYALISYVTTQRTSEIGIRMALGAQRSSILHLVLWNALSWVAIGLAVGSLMSLLASALLNRLFAGFGGSTVSSLLAAAMILIIVGGLAGLIPARRMASLDPMRALRAE